MKFEHVRFNIPGSRALRQCRACWRGFAFEAVAERRARLTGQRDERKNFEIHLGSGGRRAGIDPHSLRFGQVSTFDENGAYRSCAMSARKSPGPTRTLCVRPMIVPEVPAV